MKRIKCAWCHQVKPLDIRQRYCSKSCAMFARSIQMSEAELSERGRKGGAGSRASSMKRYAQQAAGLPPDEAYRQGWLRGYGAGWKAQARKRAFDEERAS